MAQLPDSDPPAPAPTTQAEPPSSNRATLHNAIILSHDGRTYILDLPAVALTTLSELRAEIHRQNPYIHLTTPPSHRSHRAILVHGASAVTAAHLQVQRPLDAANIRAALELLLASSANGYLVLEEIPTQTSSGRIGIPCPCVSSPGDYDDDLSRTRDRSRSVSRGRRSRRDLDRQRVYWPSRPRWTRLDDDAGDDGFVS